MPTVIPDLIAELTGEAGGGPIRREDALDLLRRHLGRIQSTVQDGFEAHELSGLAAARWLAALSDGLMTAIHRYALAMVPPVARPRRTSHLSPWSPPAAMAAASWHPIPISTCSSSPTRRPGRGRSGWWSSCSTSSGTSG
ncbi:hypothetical protein [Dankookia sp. P2]|uniref:hypothetical protein n=1 Tax=Dankookia sp. P2 TaxID=3423955 RepID=UPI003D67EC50